ncbi:haloacid dehalogenase superfamily, subfamily IA, variant 3 with third motif having DD or ED [Vibrio xiamenensis]|uniref:Haloacid dehalogenase superfamily, subfamily IA, variant 3 with third motif having DD or ED n=1 Tax=Vibrio xiamenensis TaxID=861298 RepID=A0A1G8G7F2_9VIBR|nr:HAD family phosphatase [Vibrio xiamenensis]SDH90335.1 haloacid dehalogenase superfamily, subfamily IA, variant 3 with third motif having DD or ED [Vibrio xiamenensis]
MLQYQAYLFDMDGTLVQSEPLKGQALAMACHDFGAKVSADIYKAVMGESWSVVTGHFFKQGGIAPQLDEFNLKFRAHYQTLLANELKVTQGAIELLQHLKAEQRAVAVVSSAATWMVDEILNRLGIAELFDVVITQEHVSRHKPDPQAYDLALSQLALKPSEVLVFEDSNAGVEAGVRAGCDVVAIRHDFNGQNDLSKALAVIEVFDPQSPHL